MLRRAEDIRKKRQRAKLEFKKEQFKFGKSMFDKEKCGSLMVSKEKLEDYLEKVHKDQERSEELVLPSDIPPVGEIEISVMTAH